MEVATALLLPTRLHRPRLDPDWVQRPRLEDLLNTHPHRSLTLVIAPAGFGKTTLISQWLAGRAEPVAWLSLNADDADPERFFAYFVAAIRTVLPDACAATLSLLGGNRLPPLRQVTDTLIKDLMELPQRLVLVLDDYHTMNAQALHQEIFHLIGHLPDTMHLVVSSRIDPPWSLGRLRLQRRLVELRAVDLRFTLAEVSQFLACDPALDRQQVDIATLYERTEGWIAGLHLIQISLQASADPVALVQGLRGTDRYIMEYLVDEVFAHQPPEVQKFLLASAITERFCASLGDALLESEPSIRSHDILAYLDQHNLFLIPLDNERVWYRYHHLFRDLLMHKLRVEWEEARLLRLHQQASHWFAAWDLSEEAVRHALWANQPDQAAQIILHQLRQPTTRTAGYRYCEPLLALIPEAVMQAQPALLVAKAHVHYLRWELAATSSCITQAETLLARDPPVWTEQDAYALHGAIEVLHSIVCYWQGTMSLALEHAERALQHTAPAHVWSYGHAITYRAFALAGSGAYAVAVRFLHDQLVMFTDPAGVCHNFVLLALATVNLLAGNLDQVLSTARLLATEHPQKGIIWYTWGYYLLARAHYERNELAAAAAYFTQAMRYPYRTNVRIIVDSLAGLAMISQAQGDLDQAQAYVEQARTHVEESNSILLFETATACEARLALLQGQREVAIRKIEALDAGRYCGTLSWFELARLDRAQLQIAHGTPASLSAATALLETSLRDAESVHNIFQMIRILVLQALALWQQGDTQGALSVLNDAVEWAAPGGCVRTFVDAGAEVAEMLGQLAMDAHPHAAYINHILSAFSQELPPVVPAPLVMPSLSRPAAQVPGNQMLLTEREVEILRLLAMRLSGGEIAQRLVISAHTVKKHTSNIYSKLGVGSRREAVARALELGVLQSEHLYQTP